MRRAVVRLRRGMLATLRGRRFGKGKRVWREEGMRRRCVQGCDGECGHGFVETAHHDAGVVVPCCGYAVVAERPA